MLGPFPSSKQQPTSKPAQLARASIGIQDTVPSFPSVHLEEVTIQVEKKVYKNPLLRSKQGVGKAKRAVKPLGIALRMGKGPQSGAGSQKQDSLCLRKSLGNPHTAPRSGAGANSPGKSRWSGKGGKYPVSLFPVPGKSALSPPLVPPSLSVPVASPRSPDLPRKVLPFTHMDI